MYHLLPKPSYVIKKTAYHQNHFHMATNITPSPDNEKHNKTANDLIADLNHFFALSLPSGTIMPIKKKHPYGTSHATSPTQELLTHQSLKRNRPQQTTGLQWTRQYHGNLPGKSKLIREQMFVIVYIPSRK